MFIFLPSVLLSLLFLLPDQALSLADLRPEDYTDSGVPVLTSETFEETIKKNRFVLVQFYAPWCGHCKQFRPEYLKAAAKLNEKHGEGSSVNPLDKVIFASVDATAETKLAEMFGVRGYPTLKFFVHGKDMEYGGGRMAENIVAWIEKKSGPPLVELKTAEEVSVFFDEKAKDATPSGTDMAVGGGVIVAFCDDPEKLTLLEDVAHSMDDIFFGVAPVSAMSSQIVDAFLIQTTQQSLDAEADKFQYPRVSLQQDTLYIRFPYDSGHAIAPILSGEATKLGKSHPEYAERAGDDIRFFIAIHMLPNISTFTGENAAMVFNDPRPILVFFRDEARGSISEKHKEEIDAQTKLIEKALPGIAEKYKQDFVVVLSGAEQPMEMRFMDYVTVDYEDLPCIRIVKNPTDSMVKYKLPISVPAETEDKDLSYLNSALALTPEKIESFANSFLVGEAIPHLKSQPSPKNNHVDQGQVFTLVGEQFVEIVTTHNTLVLYTAPWCGHCKKLEPIYRELAAKYNVAGSDVLITSFDNTANDLPLEVEDIIEGYPTLKLYRKSATDSVHYAGDRHLETMIEFIQTSLEGVETGAEGKAEL